MISLEELHAHNAEDEPENQTHQQHVADTGDGLDQSVHHHLSNSTVKVT